MAKKEKEEPEVSEAEEEYSLIYKMWITNLDITVEDGGTVIFQTGSPKTPPPPHGGG